MTRARSVIWRAIGLARHRGGFLLALAALLAVPLSLVAVLDDRLLDSESATFLDDLAQLTTFGADVGLELFGTTLYTGAAVVAIRHSAGASAVATVLREARWPALIAVDALFAFALSVASLPTLIAFDVELSLGLAVASLLFVVAGVVFFSRYALVGVVAGFGESGVREAFRRSAALARDAHLLVIGILLPAYLASEFLLDWVAELVTGSVAPGSLLFEWGASVAAETVGKPFVALLSLALVLELEGRPQTELQA